jgi:hypothetical protein
MVGERATETTRFLISMKNGIWILWIPAWLFGMVERGIIAWADRLLTLSDVFQVLTAGFFLVSWLFLKPSQFDR